MHSMEAPTPWRERSGTIVDADGYKVGTIYSPQARKRIIGAVNATAPFGAEELARLDVFRVLNALFVEREEMEARLRVVEAKAFAIAAAASVLADARRVPETLDTIRRLAAELAELEARPLPRRFIPLNTDLLTH